LLLMSDYALGEIEDEDTVWYQLFYNINKIFTFNN
jgi:hypothetical protein